MRSWLASILLVVVSVPLLAQTAAKPQTSTTTTTTTTTTTKTKPKSTKSATTAKKPMAKPTPASEMSKMRDALSAQQQQIQMLRDELARRDAAMQQVQQQVNALQSTAQQAQTTAQAAESSSKQNEDALAALKTNVGTVSTTATATATSLQATDKAVKALENPAALKYKGITITPGGFIAAQMNWRSHNQNLDNFGSFGAIPFDNTSNAHLNEFRLTGRYSRLSLLAQGKFGSHNVQAYYEMDFEGAAQTANENQTNSFQPRIRELWANVDGAGGTSFVGGQTWSLLTANRTGVGPRGLALPSHISASLIVGFHYTRQTGFRVYKKWDLTDKRKVYFAFAVENPETVSAGVAPGTFLQWGLQNSSSGNPTAAGANCAVDRGNGTTYGQNAAGLAPCSTFASGTSIDYAPDLIAKAALEPGWGHFELAVIGRFFRNRLVSATATGVSSAGQNHSINTAGVSANAVLPVVPKKVDLVISTLAGRGIGRYSTAGVPDVTFRPDGRLIGVYSWQGSLGIETHPSPKWDFNVYLGDEYTQRNQYFSAGVATPVSGYGVFNANLTGCEVELLATGQACTPSNRNVWQISPGFWYRFDRGPAGTIQYGMYYSHFRRYLWSGFLNASGTLRGAPNANQDEILTSLRWYFP
jgi:hypothetical protein